MDFTIKKQKRTSLVVQWLGICLLKQQTLVQFLVRDNSTCGEATKPMCRDYWACALGLVLHKRSHCKRKSTHCNESGLPCCNYRKSACSNEDPAQPKLKLKKQKKKSGKRKLSFLKCQQPKKLKVQIHCLCPLLSLSRTRGFLSPAFFCETAPFSLCFLCLTIL